MALSKSEYFKNIFTQIVQSTGSIVNAQSPEEMRAFVRAAKIDAAINVRNWNKFVFPIMKTLRSSPEHEYDVLDTEKGGLSGWTITTELWATEDSMECLWDFTRGQPHSITGSILCLAAKIAAIAATKDHEHEVYDDTSIKALIECIELNLEQAKKDLFGECYIWDCDGDANLPYPLARHIHEIFTQLVIGAPSLGLDGCFTGDYPTLKIEHPVSELVYDELIPSTGVEYCSNTVAYAFDSLVKFTGQSICNDPTPDYSLKSLITAPSPGNLILADGADLATGMKNLDSNMIFYTYIKLGMDGGTMAAGSDSDVSPEGPLGKLTLVAGPGIEFDATNNPTTSDTIKISSTATGGTAETLQLAYDAGVTTTGGLVITDKDWPHHGSIVFQESGELFSTSSGIYGLGEAVNIFEVQTHNVGVKSNPKLWGTGKHTLYISDSGGALGSSVTDLQSTGVVAGPSTFKYYHNQGYEDVPLLLRPLANFTPDTTGETHPNNASFPTAAALLPQGALWISNGQQAVPDRDGNPQQNGHLYYREPSGGDIWHLLCCGSGGGGTSQNLQQTYDFDSGDAGTNKDGGKIVLDVTSDTPAGIHIYDGATSVTSPGLANWLSLYDHPLFAVGKNSQAADGDAYLSVSRAAGNYEIAVNAHVSPINLSTRGGTLPSDPLTGLQGSLYSKNVSVGISGATEAHPHWICPVNGTVYDLTNTGGGGGGGGAANAWRSLLFTTEAGSVGSSVSGDGVASSMDAESINTNLQLRAGNYIDIRGQDGGLPTDIINFSVNPMPTTFLSDISSVAATVDHKLLYWDDSESEYKPGTHPVGEQVDGGTTPSPASNFGRPFYADQITTDAGGFITEYKHQFRRLIGGSNVTIAESGSGGKDIVISAATTAGSGATKTTELTDVDNTWPSTTGALLSFETATNTYFPSYIVNSGGGGAELYTGYETGTNTHPFRDIKSTGTYSGAIDITEAAKTIEFAFDPSALTLDDFADVATGSDYPAAGADDGAVLVWDKTTNKWKKESRITGISGGGANATLFLRPHDWDQLSHHAYVQAITGNPMDPGNTAYDEGVFHDDHDGKDHTHERQFIYPVKMTPTWYEYGMRWPRYKMTAWDWGEKVQNVSVTAGTTTNNYEEQKQIPGGRAVTMLHTHPTMFENTGFDSPANYDHPYGYAVGTATHNTGGSSGPMSSIIYDDDGVRIYGHKHSSPYSGHSWAGGQGQLGRVTSDAWSEYDDYTGLPGTIQTGTGSSKGEGVSLVTQKAHPEFQYKNTDKRYATTADGGVFSTGSEYSPLSGNPDVYGIVFDGRSPAEIEAQHGVHGHYSTGYLVADVSLLGYEVNHHLYPEVKGLGEPHSSMMSRGFDRTPDLKGFGQPGGYTGTAVDEPTSLSSLSNAPAVQGGKTPDPPTDWTSLWNNHLDNIIKRMPYEPTPGYAKSFHDTASDAVYKAFAGVEKPDWSSSETEHPSESDMQDAHHDKKTYHNWAVHNGVEFIINGETQERGYVSYDNQAIYCAFPTQHTQKDGAWTTYKNMRCTAYFVGPGTEMDRKIPFEEKTRQLIERYDDASNGYNKVSYEVATLHDNAWFSSWTGASDGSSASRQDGSPVALIEGQQLTNLSFGGHDAGDAVDDIMSNCFKTATTKAIKCLRQVSVVEFDAFEFVSPHMGGLGAGTTHSDSTHDPTGTSDDRSTYTKGKAAWEGPGGLIHLRLRPKSGFGIFNLTQNYFGTSNEHVGYTSDFNEGHNMSHYFLGMRIDFY